jgi:NhaA family Na+:H+ antiporter
VVTDPARVPIDRLLAPFREFAHSTAAGGILLMGAAIVALVWANSPFAASYEALWHTGIAIDVGGFELRETLLHWINDGLMAVFFLVVGLEIKREILVGELASVRRATLPIAAAIGGAVLPAAIFLVIAGTGEAVRGWGIPMATDIAFALGVLALLGSRAPVALRVFLAALAIVDDLLAVLVIAIFYTADLSLPALGAACAILVLLLVANALGVRRPVVYGALGLALWFAVFQSGVHATVAGVLLALTIPARTRLDPQAYLERARGVLAEFAGRAERHQRLRIQEHHAALWELEDVTERAQAPMMRIENALHPWVSFGIVPLFALANAGVTLGGDLGSTLTHPVTLGVLVGLVLGKQVGITLAAMAVVRLGLASLPAGVTVRHVYGVAWLGGIGFTMSLFIGGLAYGDGALLDVAKVGILAASVVAGVGGYLLLRFWAARNGAGETGGRAG